jgi:DHA2 family methylenomycin A resistance protein-like MFS transporter
VASTILRRSARAVDAAGDSRSALVVAAVGFGLIMLHTTAVNLALPAIRADLGGGVSGLQWCVGAYSLAFASLLLPAGALIDRHGARRVFTWGLGLLGLAALLSAAAPGMLVLVACQAVAGGAAAMVAPSSLSIVRGAFPVPAERARAVALLSLGMAAGFGAGPVIGGALTELVGWRALFLSEVPCCLALILSARARVRAVAGGPGHAPDARGVVLGVLALGSMTLALIEAGDRGWTAPIVAAGGAAALLFGAAFVHAQRTGAAPLLPARLLHTGQLPSASLIGLLFNFAVYGELFLLSLYFQRTLGLSPLVAGLLLLPQPIGTVIVAPIVARALGRIGPRGPTLIAMSLSTAAALLLLGTGRSAAGLACAGVGLLLAGMAGGLVVPSLHTVVVVSSPSDLVGTASAAFNASRQVGGVLGIAVLGGLVQDADPAAGMVPALLVAAAVQVVALAIAWRLLRPGPADVG